MSTSFKAAKASMVLKKVNQKGKNPEPKHSSGEPYKYK